MSIVKWTDGYYAARSGHYDATVPYYDDTDHYYGRAAKLSNNPLVNKAAFEINSQVSVVKGGWLNQAKSADSPFVGNGSADQYTLAGNPAYSGSVEVHAIAIGPIPNHVEWLAVYHFTEVLNGDGYVIGVTPVNLWSTGVTFLVKYAEIDDWQADL